MFSHNKNQNVDIPSHYGNPYKVKQQFWYRYGTDLKMTDVANTATGKVLALAGHIVSLQVVCKMGCHTCLKSSAIEGDTHFHFRRSLMKIS